MNGGSTLHMYIFAATGINREHIKFRSVHTCVWRDTIIYQSLQATHEVKTNQYPIFYVERFI